METREDYIIYGIKLLYMCICSIIIFYKITDMKINSKKEIALIPICIGIIVLICTFFTFKTIFTNTLIYITICLYLEIISKKNIGNIMFGNIVSWGIYYISYFISAIFAFEIDNVVNIKNKFISMTIIILIQQLLLGLFFSIKRFKNGFQFLKKEKNNMQMNSVLIGISSIFIYLCSLFTYNIQISSNDDINFVGRNTARYIAFSMLFFAIVMMIIIRESLTIYYKQKLLENTLKDYENQLKEKDDKIQKLSDEKYKISKLNHEFYNRQKALMLKVETALENMNFEVGEEIDLKDKIKALSDEYSYKAKKNKLESNLPKTDIEEIDDMFTYMNSECKNNGIEFILQVNGNINHLVNKYIEKSKLVTLIGDHLRDAIIAVNYSENKYKSILAILGIKDDNYEFCVYDSGIEFEIETFDKLGLEPATTHKDNNGTGIGFITTFETLKETKASFILEELNELKENNYTKALKFIFDNKSRLEIISYRSDELRNKLILNRFNIIKSGK